MATSPATGKEGTGHTPCFEAKKASGLLVAKEELQKLLNFFNTHESL